MSELDNVTKLKHLNYLLEQTADAIAAQKILDTMPARVASETAQTNSGYSYIYSASGADEGYYQGKDTEANYLSWREEDLNTNGSNITGLVSGLTVQDAAIVASNGYQDGKLYAVRIDSAVPQLDANISTTPKSPKSE